MKKRRRILLVVTLIFAGIIIYAALNFKELKQNFVNGVNDGKAQKAQKEKK